MEIVVRVKKIRRSGSLNSRVEFDHPTTGEVWTTLVSPSNKVEPGFHIVVRLPRSGSPKYIKTQARLIRIASASETPVAATSSPGSGLPHESRRTPVFNPSVSPSSSTRPAYNVYRFDWFPWKQSLPSEDTSSFNFVDDVNAGLKAFIPPSYLNDLEQLILFGKPVLLVGSAGIGKTIGVEYLANKHGKEFYRVNFDGGMTPESFIGGVRVEAKVDHVTGASNSVTFFQNGPVVNAAVNGGWLLLDELDKAQPEYAAALHAMLESVRNPIRLNDDGGRLITPHPDFRIIATANTLGDVEDSSLGFFGSSPMNAAFKDRFSIFRVSYPENEFDILMKVFPCKDLVTKTLRVASHVRESIQGGFSSKLGVALSPRRLVAFLTTFRLFCTRDATPETEPEQRNHFLKAIQYEVTSRLNSEDNNLVMQFFSDVFGQKNLSEVPDLIQIPCSDSHADSSVDLSLLDDAKSGAKIPKSAP
jgi:hypothetical protein